MGCNYYYHESAKCPCCNRECEPIHIGKSSAGWCFALHVTGGIKFLDDWKILFQREGSYIVNEYGDLITVDEMISIITDRSWPPHGLKRHFDSVPGDGTYDYISIDFS